MPIYEFYCPDCHMIFSFLSRAVNTTSTPACPKCKGARMTREVSAFAVTGRAPGEEGEGDDLPFDEGRMESALSALAGEAEGLDEDNPRDAARLMRKFSSMTGMEFGPGMQEALGRMEAGEDPDRIEAEMGDALESEDPFIMPGQLGGIRKRLRQPERDETLYEL